MPKVIISDTNNKRFHITTILNLSFSYTIDTGVVVYQHTFVNGCELTLRMYVLSRGLPLKRERLDQFPNTPPCLNQQASKIDH